MRLFKWGDVVSLFSVKELPLWNKNNPESIVVIIKEILDAFSPRERDLAALLPLYQRVRHLKHSEWQYYPKSDQQLSNYSLSICYVLGTVPNAGDISHK